MAKIAVLTDTHFGVRNNSNLFLNHFFGFFERQFFPEIEARGIKDILHLGDFYDNRRFLNILTLSEVNERIIKPLEKYNTTFLVGNHDTYYRNTNHPNILRELFDQFRVVDSTTEMKLVKGAKESVLLVPWIPDDAVESELGAVQESNCRYVFGHLELLGYEVLRGVDSKIGHDPNVFSKFEAVYSGHFHHKHSKGNIHYIGTPYQMTFSDLGEPKGWYVLDSDTMEMEYVRNRETLFEAVEWKKGDKIDTKSLVGKFLKLSVVGNESRAAVNDLVSQLTDAGIADVSLQMEEEKADADTESSEGKVEDTLTLIDKEIDQLGVSNPDRVKKLVREIHASVISRAE